MGATAAEATASAALRYFRPGDEEMDEEEKEDEEEVEEEEEDDMQKARKQPLDFSRIIVLTL